MTVAINDRLFHVRMNRRFGSSHESRSQKHAVRSQGQRGDESAPVGDAAGRQHRQRSHGPNDHGHERHRSHPTHVAPRFGSLRHDDIRTSLGTSDGQGYLAGHVHNLSPRVVRAAKVFAQILIQTRPCKGHNRRPGAEGHAEHFILRKKQ